MDIALFEVAGETVPEQNLLGSVPPPGLISNSPLKICATYTIIPAPLYPTVMAIFLHRLVHSVTTIFRTMMQIHQPRSSRLRRNIHFRPEIMVPGAEVMKRAMTSMRTAGTGQRAKRPPVVVEGKERRSSCPRGEGKACEAVEGLQSKLKRGWRRRGRLLQRMKLWLRRKRGRHLRKRAHRGDYSRSGQIPLHHHLVQPRHSLDLPLFCTFKRTETTTHMRRPPAPCQGRIRD